MMRWLVLLLLLPSTAHATVVGDWLTYVSPSIPGGGVIILEGSCSITPCTWHERFQVLDASGAVVPGAFRRHATNRDDDWGFFVPEQPFVAGSELTVRVQEMEGSTHDIAVSVLAAKEFDPSTVRVSLKQQRIEMYLGACCPTGEFLPDQFECVRIGTSYSVLLSASLLHGDDTASSQYVFGITLYPEGMLMDYPLRRLTDWPEQYEAKGEPSERYCYLVRAVPVRGGDVSEILAGCEPTQYADLTPTRLLSDEQAAEQLARCAPYARDAGVQADEDAGAAPEEEVDGGVRAPRVKSEGCQLGHTGDGAFGLALLLLLRRRLT